jgi:hypothetical protein
MHGYCLRCLSSVDPEARQAGHPWCVRNKSYKMGSKFINRVYGATAPFRIEIDEFPCCKSTVFELVLRSSV